MSKVSLRRLLSKLTALALSTTVVGPAAAAPSRAEPELGELGARVPDALDDEDLDAREEIDREQLDAPEATAALGRTLALALGELRPLAATHLAATWALSAEPLRRAAVAHALEWSFPLVGDAVVIDHLSRDPDPEIRIAAARAAWTRRRTGGDPGVLERLASDPHPAVRAVVASARWS